MEAARRDKPEIVPVDNPFIKMGLSHKAKPTRPVTLQSDAPGAPPTRRESIHRHAAMIAFFWLQRQVEFSSA